MPPVKVKSFSRQAPIILNRVRNREVNRKTALLSAALLIATAAVALGQAPARQDQLQKLAASSPAAIPATITELRQAARLIPGRRPLRINVVKFAESRRTQNFSVKGAPAVPSVQARTAYQVVYPDGTIMIDAGMDQQVHKFFGRGAVEPYDSEAAKQVEKALRAAKFIVVTHEHGDHAAGVIRTPYLDEIASKTVFTKTQIEELLTNPQMPEIKLTPEMAARYIVMDYERYYPFAPGIALMKAPGHTPGSQMIYVALEAGGEYLFIGDIGWHMDNVLLMKTKDAPWIKEDEDALMAQLKWLNDLDKSEKNLHIIVSHDEDQRKQYIASGVLSGAFE